MSQSVLDLSKEFVMCCRKEMDVKHLNSLKGAMTVGLIVGLLGAAADCSSGQASGGSGGSCQPDGI